MIAHSNCITIPSLHEYCILGHEYFILHHTRSNFYPQTLIPRHSLRSMLVSAKKHEESHLRVRVRVRVGVGVGVNVFPSLLHAIVYFYIELFLYYYILLLI